MSDELFPDATTIETLPAFPATVVAIHAVSPEGYPITLTLNDPAQGAMKSWIALLQKQGFTSPAANPTSAGAGSAIDPSSPPTCQNRNCSNYGKEMAPSQHGTGFYCRGKDPTTGNQKGYCKSSTK